MTDSSSGAVAASARRPILEESGDRRVLVAKAIAISIAAYATLLSLPALLGAFARELALTDRQIGWVGSAELLGVTCGTLIMAHTRGRKMKQWLFAAAALIASGNLAASVTDGFGALAACMWIVGTGAGLGGGFAYKLAGQSPTPDRAIAIVHVAQLGAALLGYQSLKILLPIYGIHGVLRGYACLGVLIAVIAASITTRDDHESQAIQWSLPPREALIVLAGFWFFCCGEVGFFAFVERIGVGNGIPVESISNALSGFSIAGIVACLVVIVVPSSWPRGVILLGALVLGEAAVFGILRAETVALFSTSTAALGIFYLFTIPIILGVVSRLDPTGRSTVLGLTVASTGQAIGPGIAGSLVTNSNYLPLGIFAAACFAISILTVLAFLRRAAQAPLEHR